MQDLLRLVTATTEAELDIQLRQLTHEQRDAVIGNLLLALGITSDELQLQILRQLIERGRPLVVPAHIWTQSIESSDPIRSVAKTHLSEKFGLHESSIGDPIISNVEKLVSSFREVRKKIRVREDNLVSANYRCQCCGHPFSDVDIETLEIELPNNLKQFHNTFIVDKLHPIHHDRSRGRPSVEHVWPVSLYGDNSSTNLIVYCLACNNGKSNSISYAHTPPNVGVYLKKHFVDPNVVTEDVFQSVLARHSSRCALCGDTADKSPLTVRRRMNAAVNIPDNLIAVCSTCANKPSP